MFSFSEKLPENWGKIDSENVLGDIIKSSTEKPQLIFKHSTRCSVSSFAKHALELLEEDVYNKLDLHYVDVIKNRPVSQYIARELQVYHESPQIIFLKDAKVQWHGSHNQVSKEVVQKLIELAEEDQ